MSEKSDRAKAVYDKMMEKDYCSQWLGLEPIILEEGHCKICLLYTSPSPRDRG